MTHNNNNVNVDPELHKIEVRKDLATNSLTKNEQKHQSHSQKNLNLTSVSVTNVSKPRNFN